MANNSVAGLRSWLYHPKFPKHWSRQSLHSLAEWVNGLAFRDIQFSADGKPIIKIAEIKNGISGQTKFTKQTFDDSVHVRDGDLLFSWSGQPETSIDAFWWSSPDGWLNQHVFKVTPNAEIDLTFFFYVLRYLKPSFVGIARNKQTTGLGHVTKRDLQNIEAAYPSLPEQRTIASILGSLDDKIELNRRMNEMLEALARALFKSWFVDFDPVRAKMEGHQPAGMDDETAALFPDSFDDSPLGAIPKGWRVGKMAEIASQRRVTLSPETEPEELFDHYSIPAFDEGRMPKVESGEQIKSNKFVVPENAVLLSRLNPRILRCWLPQIGTSRRSVCSTEYIVACPEPPFTREFLFSLFTSLPFVGEFQNLVTGTSGSHQRVKAEYWHSMDVLIPDAEIVDQFTTLARNLFLKTATNAQQNLTLAAIRDALLPKLLSGEVRVGEAERIVEERVGGRRTSPAER